MGPVAAQLADRYARPAIVVALEGDTGVGSGRSISGFDLVEALQACEGMLLRYGGHPQACGLTIESDRLDGFRERINQHAAASANGRPFGRPLRVDAEGTLEQVTVAIGEQMERCAPFGSGNPRPSLMLSGLSVRRETARRGWVSDGTRRLKLWGTLEGCAEGERYDVVVSPMLKDGELVLSLTDTRMSVAAAASGDGGLT